MTAFNLKTGKVIGYEHQQFGRNCQDAIASDQFFIYGKQHTIVVISDGSSVAEDNSHLVHTEVGATLTCDFLLYKAKNYLLQGINPSAFPYLLYDDLVEYYQVLIAHKKSSNTQSLVNYVKHHLLCTVLVLVITPENGIVMHYGDGLVVIDEQVLVFDYDDHPPYVAYQLIPKSLKTTASQLPRYFEFINFNPSNTKKIAIASDSFATNQDLIPEFWNHKHPNQIQRKLNVWSRIDHKLVDDATLAVIERSE